MIRSAGCESLIRKMLILDPNKRYTVEQIKRHPWMLEEAPRLLPGTIAEMPAEPNDQVLRFMNSLDINTTRTRQVGCSSPRGRVFTLMRSCNLLHLFIHDPMFSISSFVQRSSADTRGMAHSPFLPSKAGH